MRLIAPTANVIQLINDNGNITLDNIELLIQLIKPLSRGQHFLLGSYPFRKGEYIDLRNKVIIFEDSLFILDESGITPCAHEVRLNDDGEIITPISILSSTLALFSKADKGWFVLQYECQEEGNRSIYKGFFAPENMTNNPISHCIVIKVEEDEASARNELRSLEWVYSGNNSHCPIKLFNVGDSSSYITMPFFDGINLKDFITASDSYPLTTRLKICSHIAEAIQEIHELGIVHGNINPSNIIINPNEDFSVKLIGFRCSENRSTPKRPLGSPRYCAPELFSTKTPASDVFSMALIFHQILTSSTVIVDNRHIERELPIERYTILIDTVPLDENDFLEMIPGGNAVVKQDLFQLLNDMLLPQPESRITGNQVQSLLNQTIRNLCAENLPYHSIFAAPRGAGDSPRSNTSSIDESGASSSNSPRRRGHNSVSPTGSGIRAGGRRNTCCTVS